METVRGNTKSTLRSLKRQSIPTTRLGCRLQVAKAVWRNVSEVIHRGNLRSFIFHQEDSQTKVACTSFLLSIRSYVFGVGECVKQECMFGGSCVEDIIGAIEDWDNSDTAFRAKYVV